MNVSPTSAMYDEAENLGIEYALDEINKHDGLVRTEPQEAPLSGTGPDSLSPRDVAWTVGFSQPEGEPGLDRARAIAQWEQAVAELARSWELGYFSTWRTHLDNLDNAAITARNPEIIDVRRAP